MGDRTPAAGPARLTERDLAAIEERAEAATPGPWTPSIDTTGRAMVVVDIAPHQFREVIVADDDGPREEDLDFVAHARSDVPALLAALRAAWAENVRYREDLAMLADDVRGRALTAEEINREYHDAHGAPNRYWLGAAYALRQTLSAIERAALAAPGAGEGGEA